jgi:23S rRNA (uracil1939-C5)-methyltransferase
MTSTNLKGDRIPVAFTHMAPDGKCAGLWNGKEVRCHGVLPGEEAQVEVMAHAHGRLVGELRSRTTHTPLRTTPREDHYTYCSPWQIMQYNTQCTIKQQWLAYHFPEHSPIPFTPAPYLYGYRTKIEFGFAEQDGQLSLSVRGHDSNVPAPDGCALATPAMNGLAQYICNELNTRSVSVDQVKSIIIRESKATGRLLAVLYARVADIPPFYISMPNVSGFLIALADPERIVSTATDILHTQGYDYMEERIAGLAFQYPYDAFFQNNIPLFEQVLSDMQQHMHPARKLVELYSGVGTIGLTLAPRADTVDAYEISSSMVACANGNAKRNGIKHYRAHALSADRVALTALEQADTIVVNPTRRGLHASLVKQLRTARPDQIIYLSCNLETVSRNYRLLQDRYRISFIKGYDFYPHTPHQETLILLQRR